MKSSVLATVAMAAVWMMGFQDNGCLGEQEQPGCPELLCDVACENGHRLDENGCAMCECNAPKTCISDSECGQGFACDTEHFCEQPNCPPGAACASVCYGRCVQATPAVTACWSDDDCASGQRCDVQHYCELPPGCQQGMGCPGVCYGRCVGGETPRCEGAWYDDRGSCRGPADEVLPKECCHRQQPPPPQCGDGSSLACDALAPECDGGFVPAVYDGCWRCVDPNTCSAGCTTDAQCGPGQRCVRKNTCPPCNPSIQACADCDEQPVGVCEPAACAPVVCQLFCEYGFDTNPATGCETCRCKQAPSCICDMQYDPVCGSDGRTYGNSCEAACANAAVAHRGACGESCNIQCFVDEPVCGSDGVTYHCGATEAACHGATVIHAGACASGCGGDADCQWGEKCLSGQCRPLDSCVSAADCSNLTPAIACVGSWTCAQNQCAFVCGR